LCGADALVRTKPAQTNPPGVSERGKEHAVNRLIEEKREELERVCRRRRVHRIEVFGSGVRPDFDPAHGDLDFLVSFQELEFNQYADAYFGLLEDLQTLFERPVDLVVASAIQNPYFRQAVDSSKTLVYVD
jgi:predicted nucleotidyltransferase